jgi:lipopolysaccharide O-acetyltransferase
MNKRIHLAVVVCFLNEEEHLGRLLGSIERQSEPPDQLLLVDDGSTDESVAIADEFATRIGYARVIRREYQTPGTDRLASAPELRAFLAGVEQLEDGWDVVVKMDGDLELPSSLCREARDRFEANPRLGITGSELAVIDEDGNTRREPNPSYHVRGPNKFYRRECFETISPLPTFLGWDTIDDLRARAAEWETQSFAPTSGLAVHLRPTGLHDGRLRAYRRWGACAWAYGAHPFWVLAGAARRTGRPPRVVAGAAYLIGWLQAALTDRPRAEPEILALRRHEDLDRLRTAIGMGRSSGARRSAASTPEAPDPPGALAEFSPSPARAPLYLAQLAERIIARAYTLIAQSSLGSLGAGSVLKPSVRLIGPRQIHIGADVQLGPDTWLQVLSPQGRLSIGERTQCTGALFVSVVSEVRIGRSVLFARYVHIADHEHAHAETNLPVNEQGIAKIAPVVIEDGAWLSQGVVILPGVTIGQGAVIGANSVVRDDIPAHTVAVGAPARVVKRLSRGE